jgi:hypothetical protein
VKKDTNEFCEKAIEEILGARGAFALSRDVAGRVEESLTATQGTHDAARLLCDAKKRLAMATSQFEIWMAKQKRKVKKVLLKQHEHDLRVYNMAPASKKGTRPAEVKEGDVKNYIMSTKTYRLWKEEIDNLEYVAELADKAYFKPMESRCQLIMNLNKLVTRESPE